MIDYAVLIGLITVGARDPDLGGGTWINNVGRA